MSAIRRRIAKSPARRARAGVRVGDPVPVGGEPDDSGEAIPAGDAAQAPRFRLAPMILVGTAASRFQVPPVGSDAIVIHGETDDVVPLAAVLDWARPQDLPVVVLPGAGHFFHGRLTQVKSLILRNLGLAEPD